MQIADFILILCDYNTGFEDMDHFFFFFETNCTITYNKSRLMARDPLSRFKFIHECENLYDKLAYFFTRNFIKIAQI